MFSSRRLITAFALIQTFGLPCSALAEEIEKAAMTLEEVAALAAQGRHQGNQRPKWRTDETAEQYARRMAWWTEARFGMFIHWGVYAMLAGQYQGKDMGGVGEWIMLDAEIPIAEYQAIGRQFNPVKYDPERIVLLAKEAGMKYLVITAKHHDGFCLWESDVHDWGVKSTVWGKDLLQPLAAACKKHGLRFGLYFSHNHDWSTPGGDNADRNWDPIQTSKTFDDYYYNVAIPQAKELLTRFEDLDVFWFDLGYGDHLTPEHEKVMLDLLYKHRPNIILNDRLNPGLGKFTGDFQTHEGNFPGGSLAGAWETCMTMDGSWGFIKNVQPHHQKEALDLVKQLSTVVSRGGNYLLNIGPMGDGAVHPRQSEPLKEVGAWMRQHGEAIYGCSVSPVRTGSWGVSTGKDTESGHTVYLHILNWPESGQILVPNGGSQIQSVRWLGSDSIPNVTPAAGEAFLIDVGSEPIHPLGSVIKLDMAGEIPPLKRTVLDHADFTTEIPATYGQFTDDTGDAEIYLENPSRHWLFEIRKWNSPDEALTFPAVDTAVDKEYDVILLFRSRPEWAGNTYVFNIGEHTFEGKVEAPDEKGEVWGQFSGVRLKPGTHDISIQPKNLVEGANNLMDLQKIFIRPR